MSPESQRRQLTVSWLFVAILFALCGILGILQYQWIGEVSVAARERLRASLQGSLERVSRDFQTELTAAARAIAPEASDTTPEYLAREAGERYQAWKSADHQGRLFRTVALITREGDSLVLREPDSEGQFRPAEWPPEWQGLREFWMSISTREGRGFRGGPPGTPATVFEIPLFAFPGAPPGERDSGPRRNFGWMLFDVNPTYVGETILPELFQRHLGAGVLEYQFELTSRGEPRQLLFSADRDPGLRIAASSDASVPIA